MLFYSYDKLWTLAFGNAELIVKAFTKLYFKEEGYACLAGNDFIVNPSVIVMNKYNLTYQQRAEYLGLLALRPYSSYHQNGYTDLDMARIPNWVSAAVVKEHPLIEIYKSKLIFKEENICQD
ncbi:hypothetical protein VPHD51_0034 [Vibrio phage D51]